jgi:phosphate transport system permease protein
MTLPTVIIAGRAAIRSVPPSIREAALGVGASPLQVALQHELPLALPGLLVVMALAIAFASQAAARRTEHSKPEQEDGRDPA